MAETCSRFPYLTVADIRHAIMDRAIADNDLDEDLSFTDDEITRAMTSCARDFNSVPPHVMLVYPTQLNSDTNVFVDGTLKHLYLSKLHQHMRSDVDYTAGNVSTNLVVKRIANYKELIKLHGEQFLASAKSIKLAYNLAQAYGSF